jgi:hypothetical protein
LDGGGVKEGLEGRKRREKKREKRESFGLI